MGIPSPQRGENIPIPYQVPCWYAREPSVGASNGVVTVEVVFTFLARTTMPAYPHRPPEISDYILDILHNKNESLNARTVLPCL